MAKEIDMIVDRIQNGIVIDHMSLGRSFLVMEILDLTNEQFLKSNRMVAVAMNVRSSKNKKKDVLKISNFILSEEMREQLGLIIPNSTLNVIKDFDVVEKIKFGIPNVVRDLICPSDNCITNLNEDVIRKFKVLKKEDSIKLRCLFCDQSFKIEEFLQRWSIFQKMYSWS